jgi:hypothetical protein
VCCDFFLEVERCVRAGDANERSAATEVWRLERRVRALCRKHARILNARILVGTDAALTIEKRARQQTEGESEQRQSLTERA